MLIRTPFLSSTFVDLEVHRYEVLKTLRRAGLAPCGMEDFGSRPQEPTAAALDAILQCDALVGVYGRRYGTIPDGHTISITEQEFDFALQRGLPVYVYRLDPGFAWPD